jgi:hypothetical protein
MFTKIELRKQDGEHLYEGDPSPTYTSVVGLKA